MKLVLDTSVCIDLYHGDCLHLIKLEGWEFYIPDVLQMEMQVPNWDELIQAGIIPIILPAEAFLKLVNLRTEFKKPSMPDLFGLLVAEWLEAVLLTGDANLRKAAISRKLEVHGVLWLLDQLINCGSMAQSQAWQSLEKMLENGARLPAAEVQKRRKEWI